MTPIEGEFLARLQRDYFGARTESDKPFLSTDQFADLAESMRPALVAAARAEVWRQAARIVAAHGEYVIAAHFDGTAAVIEADNDLPKQVAV